MDPYDPILRLRERPGLRLGVMGGVFDPIHIAHLVIAEEALYQFSLDKVVFMPAGNPPHKRRGMAPAELRYLMVLAATAAHPEFLVSRYEIERKQVSYTVDTMRHLAGTLAPDAELFLVIGADAVLEILTWKDPAEVLELCTLIAATRPGYDLSRVSDLLGRLGHGLGGSTHENRVEPMEIPALAISSTMIRERLAAGRAVRSLVPEPVAQLIEKTGLYSGRNMGES